MTDLQALQRYASHRDAQAFRLLVENYQRLVYSAARRRLATSHDIEDVVQTTFLKLARAAATIRRDGGAAGLASWLYATAINSANELIRADSARRRNEFRAARTAEINPVDTLEVEQLASLVDQAILMLPAADQSLLVEHFFRGRSQRDLAAEQGVSQPAIQRRLTAAIDALRAHLAASGQACSTAFLAATLPALAHVDVPSQLTATLTKIGLASLPAPSAASTVFASLTAAHWLAGAALLITLCIAVAVPISRHMAAPIPAAAAAATSAPIFPAADPQPDWSKIPLRTGGRYNNNPPKLPPTGVLLDASKYPSLSGLATTRVSVDFDDVFPAPAFDMFRDATNIPTGGPTSGNGADFIPATSPDDERGVSMHLHDVPLLEAVLQFRNLTGYTYAQTFDPKFPVRTTSRNLAGNWTLVSKRRTYGAGNWCVTGPVAFCLTSIESTADFSNQDFSPRTQMNFVTLVEPKLNLVLRPAQVMLDLCVDEKDQPITIGRAVTQPYANVLESLLTVSLVLPPDHGQRIAKMRGSARVVLAGDFENLEHEISPDPATVMFHGLKVEFPGVNKSPLPPPVSRAGARAPATNPRANTFRYLPVIRFSRGELSADDWQRMADILQTFSPRVLSAEDSTANMNQRPAYSWDGETLVASCTFGPLPGTTEPHRIVLEMPVGLRNVDVPFEYTNIVLP